MSDRYYWSYQCHRCFIKAGHGYTGDERDALNNAPSCCGGEPMHPIRGHKVKEATDE